MYKDYNKSSDKAQGSKSNGNKAEILNDIDKRGKNVEWRKRKLNTVSLAESYLRLKMYSKAYRVEQCSCFLEFKKFFESGVLKLVKANFCRDRLCPMCAWRRSLKMFSQVNKIMNHIAKKNEYDYIFLTLTLKNCSADELSEELDKLFYGLKLLTCRKEFKKIAKGYFRCLEVTYNEERNDFHHHIHMVIAVNKYYFKDKDYIQKMQWVDIWQSCLGVDYAPNVDVRKVKPSTNDGSIVKTVAEVAKYAVKVTDYIKKDAGGRINKKLTDFLVETFERALRGRRLVGYGGEFRRVHKLLNLDDPIDGDLIITGDEEIREDLAHMIVRYNWNVGIRNYVREEFRRK